MEKTFAVFPTININRSKFNRTSTHKTAFKLGDIVPIYVDEVLPGDSRKLDLSALVRMSTPITDFMDDIVLEYYAFFVPHRLVWKDWKKFMGEASSYGAQTNNLSVPRLPISGHGDAIQAGRNDTFGISAGTLGDYFGLPIMSSSGNQANYVSILPVRAYRLIYNRWFRDQNVEAPLNVGDINPLYVDCHNQALQVAYKKSDYFTRALPYPQKGASVSVPLTGDLKVLPVGNNDSKLYTWTTSTDKIRLGLSGQAPASGSLSGDLHFEGDTTSTKGSLGYLDDGGGVENERLINGWNLYAKLSDASAVTINTLREAFAVQKLLEKDAIYGTRYWEILYGHFGVKSPDATLQDPEYLGGYSMPIKVQQVLQTTGYADGSTTELGNVGANSVTGGNSVLFNKSFVEHGTLMVLAVARQRQHTYSQGINKMWLRKGRYDFYFPEFANLGFQEIKKCELYAQGTSADDEVFGYQEAWAEYRYKPNITTGLLRPGVSNGLDFWTMTDYYGSMPTLGTTFLKESRGNISRVLATGNSGPDFIADFYFRDTATRPMPMFSIPGLIDHH